MSSRIVISKEQALKAACEVNKKLLYRMETKGNKSYASIHEIYGLLHQELNELDEAIHKRYTDADKIEELKDIAVAAIFGIASIESGGIDW